MDESERSLPCVRVFGGMGIEIDGQSISIGGARQKRLLALLAIRTGSFVSLGWLAEHLWADNNRPEPSEPAIRTYMSRLRQRLPEPARAWIATETCGYRFSPPTEHIEHLQFARLRERALHARENSDPHTAQALLNQAIALWRWCPFRELEDFDWAIAYLEQLRLDRMDVLEERWEVELAQGHHTQITGELATFTAQNGLRDRAACQYGLALHRSGRSTEALRFIDDHRRFLAAQSGVEPSAAMLELEHSILTSDPTLVVPQIGRAIRGYRLLEQIGSGAFAVVWRGVQPSVDRHVAIKQLRTELTALPGFLERFEAEAHIVARIEHPHVVPLIDYWRDTQSAYIVMRWLRGGTLRRRLDDGPLTVAQTLTLAQQMCGALAVAHTQGVIHRGVKPGNILFDRAGNAFLGDFGIAMGTIPTIGPGRDISRGSRAYDAPEQLSPQRVGPELDIFSLAVVLVECLAPSVQVHDVPEPPSRRTLRADVPVPMADALAKATELDPADRFPSMEAFLLALNSSDLNTLAAV